LAAKRIACGPHLSESQILAKIRVAANDYPELVLWRMSQGGAVTRNGQTFRAGLSVNGASDLIGIYTVHGWGVSVFLEVKSHRGRLGAEQILFLNLASKHGAICGVVRSVDGFHRFMATCKARSDTVNIAAQMVSQRGEDTIRNASRGSGLLRKIASTVASVERSGWRDHG